MRSEQSLRLSSVNRSTSIGDRLYSSRKMPEETIGLMSAVETASGRWHRRKNKETQESYYLFDKDDDDDLKQGHFTDLMLLKSVGFSANLTGNNPQISDPLMSEMIKAIAIYEINIKIVSGVISSLGNVINRFG